MSRRQQSSQYQQSYDNDYNTNHRQHNTTAPIFGVGNGTSMRTDGYNGPSHNYTEYPQYTGEPFHMEQGPADTAVMYTSIAPSSGQRAINHQAPSGESITQHILSGGGRQHNQKYLERLHNLGYDQPIDPAMVASGSANYFLDDSMAQLLGDAPGAVANDGSGSTTLAGGATGMNRGQTLDVDIITRYIVINSEDRDWVNRTDESPYNFKVSIGSGSKKNDGDMVNAAIDEHLRNVVSITCDKLTAPNRDTITGYRHTNQPFLLLAVEDIRDTTYGSSKGLKKSMAQMVPKVPIPTTFHDVTYLEFSNINQQTKVYRTPKTELYNLVIAINRADGESVNSQTVTGLDTESAGYGDVLSIEQVLYSGASASSSERYLDITTSTYFTSEFFRVGDIIKIRNWVFREAGLGYSEIAKFTAFINRDEGHIIQAVAKSTTSTTLNNVIRILSPGSYSQSTGDWEKETYFSTLITRTNINSDASNDDAGKLINSNLQTQILFRVNVLGKDSIQTQHMISTAP